MSILIKGMTMPKNCTECKMHDDGYCFLTDTLLLGEAIDHNCPLVEVKPHGRLIDADALMDKIASVKATNKNAFGVYMLYSTIVGFVDESPTIIEEEKP